ncbi:MAG: hypothetical protein MUF25_09810 [Pirellulaceae bacterium]|jgi:hypothetical protein|nr:hypothetical protein [Pirellulaceae bacterium]
MMRAIPSVWRPWIAAALLLTAGNVGAADRQREPDGSVPGGVRRYAESWVARHDADGDGKLAATEWQRLGKLPGEADTDQDAVLSVAELAQHIAKYGSHRKIRLMPASFGGGVPLPSLLRPGETEAMRQSELAAPEPVAPTDEAPSEEPTSAQNAAESAHDPSHDRKFFVLPSRLPAGLPDWFRKGDRDGDGQLTLAEYAELGSASADKEFARYDRNQDGLLTPREVLGPAATPKPAARVPALDSDSKQELATPKTDSREAK